MTPDDWQRLKLQFAAALDLSSAERGQFVEEIKRTDAELGLNLEALLQAHTERSFEYPRLSSELSNAQDAFAPGEILAGRFCIVRHLGSGGMGDVYQATDNELGRVALKTVRSDIADQPYLLSHFRKEVQLARRIGSNHVCRIHELFTIPATGNMPARAFLTMEYLEGRTLADRIARDGPIPWREAAEIAEQLCAGLTAVHAEGIVHRDVKCRNIMLSQRNGKPCVVLMDFGLAREASRAAAAGSDSTVSVTALPAGTPEYMAPEQFAGGAVSPATDIYALGVVFYEMLAGRRPFAGSSPLAVAVDRAKRLESASSLQPGIPRHWDLVIERCLQFDPAQRFQSAPEVCAGLARERRFQTIVLRRPRWPVAIAAACAVLIAALAWLYLHREYRISESARNSFELGVQAFNQGTFVTASGLLQNAVGADGHFAPSRARLADAWNELGYEGEANHQIAAVLPNDEARLAEDGRLYVDGVRAVLQQDWTAGLRGFAARLDRASATERPSASVDLGRICERAGKIDEAISAYKKAEQLAPEQPAAFLREGILQGRRANNAEAERAFATAEQLYRRLQSGEGLAELAYQRSYWESAVRHKFGEARNQAELSLTAAKNMPIPSVPLEVRAMCRLSAIDHGTGKDAEAIKQAGEAVDLAHDNGLEYWETDALLRQGAGYFGTQDFGNAEKRFVKALRTAQRNNWPRLIALAQVNLAGLRDAEGENQDRAGLGNALGYYKQFQFPIESFTPTLLLVRADLRNADWKAARATLPGLSSLAATLSNKVAEEEVEEAAGTLDFDQQHYPDALEHFERAYAAAVRSGDPEAVQYELLHRANTFAALGQFPAADRELKAVTLSSLDVQKARAICYELSFQRRFRKLIEAARSALKLPNLDKDTGIEIRTLASVAAAQTGLTAQGQAWSTEAEELARDNSDPLFENALQAKGVSLLFSGDAHSAERPLEQALIKFQQKGQLEYVWFTGVYLALAQKDAGDSLAVAEIRRISVDTVYALSHNWERSLSQSYLSRPDIAFAVRLAQEQSAK